jgi:phage shock protein PspC (stress-responsive transcriptional regulator)
MKRTYTVNIGNQVYHIDEDAHRTLEQYLDDIAFHLKSEADKEEILDDIELRIAELFDARLDTNKHVITEKDVQHVIVILGDADHFAQESGNVENEDSQTNFTHQANSKRLYRDRSNRILAGVAGGLGAYFNMDPLIFRILFLLSMFVGGAGFLVYIIMWIIVPEARTTSQRLEMRGEPITLESIKRAVREEFEQVKSRMNL